MVIFHVHKGCIRIRLCIASTVCTDMQFLFVLFQLFQGSLQRLNISLQLCLDVTTPGNKFQTFFVGLCP